MGRTAGATKMSPKLLQLARERVLKGYGLSRTVRARTRILVGLAVGILCSTPKVTFACESGQLRVPLEGVQTPFYETLGPMEVFKVRKIGGSLEYRMVRRVADKRINEDTPLPEANLILKNAISGQVVKTVTTDNQGGFEITDVPRGLYVLWIVQGDKPPGSPRIEGALLIELRPDAKDLQLPVMALSTSGCGMDVDKKTIETRNQTH